MELRHYRSTETWGQKGQGSWSRASSRVYLSRRPKWARPRQGCRLPQPRQEAPRSPEEGQKADVRLTAHAAELQPSPQAEVQATRSLGLVKTVP